jgi:hypothetical protein
VEKIDLQKAVVVSRNSVLVAGFRALIAAPRGIVAVECADAASLPAVLVRERPVLVDCAALPDPAWLREWKLRVPHPCIILWLDRIIAEFAREALQCGVRGILRKEADQASYRECLEKVAAGGDPAGTRSRRCGAYGANRPAFAARTPAHRALDAGGCGTRKLPGGCTLPRALRRPICLAYPKKPGRATVWSWRSTR